ncbi:MAG: hypothetical protein ACTHMW_12245 [Actinomycetes bacterium]
MSDWRAVEERSTELACVLAQLDAGCVVVGGTARRLRGALHRPRDLDIAVARGDVGRLVGAVRALLPATDLRGLEQGSDVRIATAWGPLDVFVVDTLPVADPAVVQGVQLEVARD